jgi:hypothetical protein
MSVGEAIASKPTLRCSGPCLQHGGVCLVCTNHGKSTNIPQPVVNNQFYFATDVSNLLAFNIVILKPA